MRLLLILASLIISIYSSGQISNLKVPQVSSVNTQPPAINDTVLKVLFVEKHKHENNPAYYLNGQFVNESLLKTLNPDFIQNIRVDKYGTRSGDAKYYGKIFITTREDYKPKLVTLNELRLKYYDLESGSVFFMIDNESVTDDYDSCLVDENYILNISIEKIANKKEKLDFNLIKITTRTKENIKKSKEIRIRGNDEKTF